jgi:pyruvate dehydrogenase E1 component alpha subunit
LSIQVRGTDQVSLCFFGDGAANQGTFGESLNLAAIWKLPVIFVCENNQYAISTPAAKTHGQPDVAKRAVGYGISGEIVDGQDVTAVYATIEAAVSRARRGAGPTLIEAKTYRFDEHCTGLNIPIPYRTEREVQAYSTQRDPVRLLRDLMLGGNFAEADVAAIEADVESAVTEALRFARESPYPDPSEVYDDLYANPIHYPPRATARGSSHDRDTH